MESSDLAKRFLNLNPPVNVKMEDKAAAILNNLWEAIGELKKLGIKITHTSDWQEFLEREEKNLIALRASNICE